MGQGHFLKGFAGRGCDSGSLGTLWTGGVTRSDCCFDRLSQGRVRTDCGGRGSPVEERLL